jgi:hypothetical protein
LEVWGRDPAEAVACGRAEGEGADGEGAEGGAAEGGAVVEEPAVIWGTERQPMHAASESATRVGRMVRIVPLFGPLCAVDVARELT